MRLAFTDSGNDPATLTTRQAYDLISGAFGPGFNGPLVLAAELPSQATSRATLTLLDRRLASVPAATIVPPPRIGKPAARTTTIPAGTPASGNSGARLAPATAGR